MDLTACPDCDLLQTLPELEPGSRARCARCGHVLVDRVADPITRPLALSVAAAILLVIANTMPMMSMLVVGRHAGTTILGGCLNVADGPADHRRAGGRLDRAARQGQQVRVRENQYS